MISQLKNKIKYFTLTIFIIFFINSNAMGTETIATYALLIDTETNTILLEIILLILFFMQLLEVEEGQK